MYHVLPEVQCKQYIKIIHFFWQVNFDLIKCDRKNIYTEKVKYIRKIYFYGVRLKLFDVIFIKSHNTCISQLASSIVFGSYSSNFCAVSSQQNTKEEPYDLRSLAFRSMFDIVLTCVFLINCNLLWHSSFHLYLHFGRKKKKKTDNNHIKK